MKYVNDTEDDVSYDQNGQQIDAVAYTKAEYWLRSIIGSVSCCL